MKTLFTLSSLVLTLAMLSQAPVLTNDQFFLMMDLELPYEILEAQAQDPGPIGADISWDFSSMTPEGSSVVLFTAIENIPHPEAFPVGSFAFNDNSGAYLVYESNSTGLFELGYDNFSAAGTYDDPEQRLVFPMNFGDSFTDDFEGVFSIGDDEITRTGSISVDYNAYGDILLPFGLVENVAKVHVQESITEEAPWGLVQIENVLDIWYQANSGRSVMEIWMQNFDGIQTQGSRYRDQEPTDIAGFESDLYSIYPNPSSSHLTISGHSGQNEKFSIVDVTGKEVTGLVSASRTTTGSMQLDISRLSVGYYFLRLSDGIRMDALKFLVVD